jgi:hypothetical protein
VRASQKTRLLMSNILGVRIAQTLARGGSSQSREIRSKFFILSFEDFDGSQFERLAFI